MPEEVDDDFTFEFIPPNGDVVVEIEPIKPDYLTVGDLIEKLKIYNKDLQVAFIDQNIHISSIRSVGTLEYERGDRKLTVFALSEMSLEAMKHRAMKHRAIISLEENI
jgi:hypothetical protein